MLRLFRQCSAILAAIPVLLLISCKTESVEIPEPSSTLSTQALLGYPSSTVSEYLFLKPQYVLSYQPNKGIARWVAWHLQTSDLGEADRQNDFRSDNSLPGNFAVVRPTDYSGSGFDRGHLCPSGDRNRTSEDNSATFLMSNMIPQAPSLNRGVWNDLEEYCRTKVKLGLEAYIYAGGFGEGGKGSEGERTILANGKVSVPKRCWKVILIMPEGENDLARIASEKVEVIAVNMPNSQDVAGTGWKRWQVTVRELETATGMNFFSELPQAVQDKIEK